MKNFIIKKETNKKIFIQDNFLSVFRSILATPIFSIKNRADIVNIEEKNVFGYDKIKITSTALNLTLDYNLFLFILRENNKLDSNKMVLNIKDFYEFIDLSSSNKNAKFKGRINDSLLKLRTLSVMLEKNGKSVITGFINNAYVDENNIVVELSELFKNFWIIDKDQIYNIDVKFYNSLKSEYSKSLYLFYTCNNANEKNVFDMEVLKKRLLCENVENKKFYFNVREAHKELVSKGFIKSFKENHFDKKIETIDIFLNKNLKLKDLDIEKENNKEMKKEVKTIKPKMLPEVAEYSFEEEISEELRVELESYKNMEVIETNMDDTFNNKFF